MTPPIYPDALNRAGIAGIVLLGVRVGADGRSEEVTVIQSTLLDVKGRQSTLRSAAKLFEYSAVSAAKRWRYNVTAKRDVLLAKDMTVAVPIMFLPYRAEQVAPGKWRTEVRAPRHEIAWLEKDKEIQRIGVSDLLGGEMMPVASTIRLASDVVGTVL